MPVGKQLAAGGRAGLDPGLSLRHRWHVKIKTQLQSLLILMPDPPLSLSTHIHILRSAGQGKQGTHMQMYIQMGM